MLLSQTPKKDCGSLLISIAILIGFAFSAFSTAIAFGFFGINSYPVIFLIITAISWLLTLLNGSQFRESSRISRTCFDKFVILPMVWVIILSRTYMDDVLKGRFHSGSGPDNSQNLMAAISADSLGKTWWEQSDHLLTALSTNSIEESVPELFSISSTRSQAGFDYLVLGGRWGFPIPYSQMIRLIGADSVSFIQGVILVTVLFALTLITFAICSLFTSSKSIQVATSILVVSNPAFLFQYFNGGLSQAWGTIGIFGIVLAISLVILKEKHEIPMARQTPGAIFLAAFLILFVTYMDAAIVMILFSLIFVSLLAIFERGMAKKLSLQIATGGLLAGLIASVPIYSHLLLLQFRFQSSSATGYNKGLWSFPSELMGMVDVYSQEIIVRGAASLMLGVAIFCLFFVGLFTLVRKHSWMRIYGLFGYSALITLAIGASISFFSGERSNYVYHKFGVYLSLILVLTFVFSLLYGFNSMKAKGASRRVLIMGFAALGLMSGFNVTKNIDEQGTSLSQSQLSIHHDLAAQQELTSYNYLASYVESSSNLGLLGDIHWISKPTNSINLENRLTRGLRLICFKTDLYCNPETKEIVNSGLIKYGLRVFESGISTKEFASLGVLDRYKVNFELFGLEPIKIPKYLQGGNPYLNNR
jgi:hypothetical protein